MSLVNKAVWFVETHHAETITLDDVAKGVGVSRFQLVRAFGVGTGYTVMRYLRARRLSIAAQALARGEAANILEVALAAGYSSHEAFTRAFRDQFGVTPESVRLQRHLSNIQLVEAFQMTQDDNNTIQTPRIETHGAFLVVGLRERYGQEASQHAPAQWQRFTPYIGAIPAQVGNCTYGVGYNGDDDGNIDYLCGVEVTRISNLPDELDHVRVPERRYAVFTHAEHVSSIRQSWDMVWNQWLSQAEYTVADAPFFERYGEDFDPETGFGTIVLWVPIQ